MSKFDLRDISERLTRSANTEAVVSEFLGYLQAIHSDWRAALAFYEVSRDSLVKVYERRGSSLVGRDVTIPVDHLPTRLVRKFFHPSSFFNQGQNRSMLSQLFQGSPYYEPDPVEAPALRSLVPISEWQSCTCLPLADHEDMLALLVIASEKKNAFTSKAMGEIIPIKSMAALALAQHLHQAPGRLDAKVDARAARQAAVEFQDHIRKLNEHAQELEADNRAKSEKLTALAGEIELLDRNSSEYKNELGRVKIALFALEEQTGAATVHLQEAYTELHATQTRMTDLERTVSFMKDVFQVLSQEHDPQEFARTLVSWLCEHFGVERCSLMLLEGDESLRIAAHHGMDPAMVGGIKVRVGQGIAGWVAHNRKPLYVRVREDATSVSHTDQDTYNSDSFICVPLIYNNRLCGVLNLSNKRDGEPFEPIDLDRAVIAGAVVAISVSKQEAARRASAWT